MNKIKALVLTGLFSATLGAVAFAQATDSGTFQLESTEFTNGGTLPITAISEYPYNGVNACSINGATGGDISPELHWSNVPPRTRSFVVMVYDATGAVLHWGMYNISSGLSILPRNAGNPTSQFGLQVTNFEGDQSYDGPCPPPGVAPDAHQYVFTIYALDEYLDVYAPTNFPPSGLTLYRDLLEAARGQHVVGSASLIGFYSTTPPAPPTN